MKGCDETRGLLIVISAPSGTGKSSVVTEILKIHPEIKFSVSVTTRQPRKGEHDGVHYYFVSDEEFDACIKKGDFIEWVIVHGNRYGTLKSTVQEVLAKHQGVILFRQFIQMGQLLNEASSVPEVQKVLEQVQQQPLLKGLIELLSQAGQLAPQMGEQTQKAG